MRLAEMLEIEPGITAIIGGGGKSTLMEVLARELCAIAKDTAKDVDGERRISPRIILCTTTKMYPPKEIPLICPDTMEEIEQQFFAGNPILCVAGGKITGPFTSEKLIPPSLSIQELSKLADYVLVEADGAKHLPLKAHASHEPAIPESANQVILVMGVDGIGKPIKDTCHRPELYAQRTHQEPETIVTPEIAMELVREEGLGSRIFINKVEQDVDWETAKKMAEEWNRKTPIAAGSLQKGEYRCL